MSVSTRKLSDCFLAGCLKQRLLLQIEEALGPENRWYAGEKLGRSPTESEAILYYIENGGAESFSKRYCSVD